MKNKINFKSIMIQSIFMLIVLFLTASCADKKPTDSKEIAEQKNIDALAVDDQTIVVVEDNFDTEFLMDAAEMQLEDVSLGKLAQQKGSSSHVKELGKMMEDDHNKIFGELSALAKSKSIAIPSTIIEDSKGDYAELNTKKGNDFGKSYSDLMIDHHEDAIELFEKASTDAKDSDIRTWAANQLPGLKTHLSHAEACKKECDKM